MATVEELIKQYETDDALKAEVDEILADNKITIKEFLTFAKNHHLEVSVTELPKYIEEAKAAGLIK